MSWKRFLPFKTVGSILQHISKKGLNETYQIWRHNNDNYHGFGELKGVDQLGNKYYENLETTPGKTRYVIYGDRSWWFAANAQNVPPEWHGWLHHTVKETPYEENSGMQIPVKFQVSHQLPNSNYLSKIGSNANYLPPGHYLKNIEKENDYLQNTAQGNDYVLTNYSRWGKTDASPSDSSVSNDAEKKEG